MQVLQDSYQDVARIYIAMIKKYNLEAGRTIEQIHATVGARAAVLATLVVTLPRMEIDDNYQNHDRSIYAVLVKDYPDALPLLNHAIECCSTWTVPDPTVIYQRSAGSSGTDSVRSSQSVDRSPNLPN